MTRRRLVTVGIFALVAVGLISLGRASLNAAKATTYVGELTIAPTDGDLVSGDVADQNSPPYTYTYTDYQVSQRAIDFCVNGVLDSSGGKILTNRDGYHQQFLGIELTANKRLSDKWSMRGSFSWNRWREYIDNPSTGLGDPTSTEGSPNVDGGVAYVVSGGSGSKGDVVLNSNWSFGINGMYELPWGFHVSADFFGRQGYLSPLFIRRADPDGLQTSKFVLIQDPDNRRNPNVFVFNLGAAKTFTIAGRYKFTLDAQIANLFNTGRTLQENRRTNTGGLASTDPRDPTTTRAFLRQREIVAPRIFTISARFGF